MINRNLEESIFKILMKGASILIVGSLFLIVITILVKGLRAFNIDMLTKIPNGGFYIGNEGGVLNAIVGSLLIAGGASVIALIVSIPIVLFINLYINNKSVLGNTIRLGYDILFGIPSIIYGAFGFTIMVYFGLKTSLLAGIITVALLVIPIMVCTMNEIIKTVPGELHEAAFSLGTTRLETSRLVLKQIYPGLITAVLLSLARGIGDAASVLFTAGYSDNIPFALDQPAATLPLAIFFQLGSPVQEVQDRAYAAALILTIVVLLISIIARISSKIFSKNIV